MRGKSVPNHLKVRASSKAVSDVHETAAVTKNKGEGKKGKGHRTRKWSSKKRSVESRDKKVERKVVSEKLIEPMQETEKN